MIQQYKLRGEICIGFASLFSYVFLRQSHLPLNLSSFQLCRGPPPHIRTRQFSHLLGHPPILSFLTRRSAKLVQRRSLEE